MPNSSMTPGETSPFEFAMSGVWITAYCSAVKVVGRYSVWCSVT